MKSRDLIAAIAGLVLAGGLASAAFAADLPTTKGAPAAPPDWWSTLTIDGNIESGIQFNPQAPTGQPIFGRLFDDKANEPLLNQATITVQRPIDDSLKSIDYGFKIELLYGSDARYTHFLGECDYCIGNINQFDVVEAWGQVHLPYLAGGGIDVKAGQWVTLLGSEVIDAPSNIFYSHSYIFNFGIPLKDTGVLAVAHVNDTVDIYAGAITGVNTSVGWTNGFAFGDPGDNNRAPGFEGGIGLNKLFGGAVTVLAATNIAPDNPNTPIGIATCGGCNPNTDWRFLNDVVVTWTATDKLTLTGEGNYAVDQSATYGSAYGAAGYASYQLLDWLKVNGRAEVFRDNSGNYVGAFPGNFDFVNTEHGFASGAYGQGPQTYGEFTAGLTITPTLPKELPYVKAVIFRPEVRYDTSLSGGTPFGTTGGASPGTKSNQTTFGGDVIVHF